MRDEPMKKRFEIKMSTDLFQRIEIWRNEHPSKLGRSQSGRTLIELGMMYDAKLKGRDRVKDKLTARKCNGVLPNSK